MVDDVSNANETWDVNEYERALAHLESLQDQVYASILFIHLHLLTVKLPGHGFARNNSIHHSTFDAL